MFHKAGASAASGLVALYLEMHSFSLMLLWCAVMMFIAGYLTLGKHQIDKLIERTLAAMPSGAPSREVPVAPPPSQPGYYPEQRQTYPDEHRYPHKKKRGFLSDLFDFD